MHMQGDREHWSGGSPGARPSNDPAPRRTSRPEDDPAEVLRSRLPSGPSGPPTPPKATSSPDGGGVSEDVRKEIDTLEERLREAFAEAERMREMNEELRQDLHRLTTEAGDALAARTRAERLQRERDEARRRASHERALAADDRLRAAEAERLHAEAEARAGEAERALAELNDVIRDAAEQLAATSGTLLAKIASAEERVLRLGEAEDVPAAESA